jgi:hypothetical protein
MAEEHAPFIEYDPTSRQRDVHRYGRRARSHATHTGKRRVKLSREEGSESSTDVSLRRSARLLPMRESQRNVPVDLGSGSDTAGSTNDANIKPVTQSPVRAENDAPSYGHEQPVSTNDLHSELAIDLPRTLSPIFGAMRSATLDSESFLRTAEVIHEGKKNIGSTSERPCITDPPH